MRKPQQKRGEVTVCTTIGHIKCTLQLKGWTNLPAALNSNQAEGFGPNAVAGNAETGGSELNKQRHELDTPCPDTVKPGRSRGRDA